MEAHSVKIAQVFKMASSLNDLRKSEDTCDFTIKVEGVSYPVHCNVLISSSEYFRGMLSHDTKERQNRVAEIQEIDSQSMKLCIEFMYTGNTDDVTIETAMTLLPASEIFQLVDLSKKCFEVMQNNLNSGNCITVMKLANAYNCSEVAELAEIIFRENFEMDNYGDFCGLDKDGIEQHISDYGLSREVALEGIINWIKLDFENRSAELFELVKVLDWNTFPSNGLLRAAWFERLFHDSDCCRNLVFKSLFLDNEILKRNIDIENCCIIDQIASEFVFLNGDTKEVILDFMRMNLMEITKKDEFKKFDKKSILLIFSGNELGLCDEASRWNAAMIWIKHNPEHKYILVEIIKFTKFDRLSKNFLKTTVETEPMLNDIPLSFKAMFNCMSRLSDGKTYVAVLFPGKKIYVMDIFDKKWQQLPDSPQTSDDAKMFTFRNKLCILNGRKLFYLGKNETKWIPRAQLKHLPKEHTAVTATSDKIFVIEENIMSCYDPESNTWDESLPGCEMNGKILAANSGDRLCVRNSKPLVRCFSLGRYIWRDKQIGLVFSSDGAMTSNGDIMYAVGFYYMETNKYQKAIRYKAGEASWVSISNNVSIESLCHLFMADQKPMLLVSGTFYIYDDMCDKWLEFCELPSYSGIFGKSDPESLDPVSVTSFRI